MDPNNSFEQYVDFALKVPMYFVQDEKKLIDVSGENFNDFIQGKLKKAGKIRATLKDWEFHISTIFHEIRLKTYLEIRSADSCSWSGICSVPAFWTGLLYDQKSLDYAYDLTKDWNFNEVNNAYLDAAKNGLSTLLRNEPIYEHAKTFIAIAKKDWKIEP